MNRWPLIRTGEWRSIGRAAIRPEFHGEFGPWLEIDTDNDGSYKMRLRALAWTKDQIVAESPTGKRAVWKNIRVTVVIQMEGPRPGLWMP